MKRQPPTPNHEDARARRLYEVFIDDMAVLYPEILRVDGERHLTPATFGTSLPHFRHEDIHIAADQVRAEANAERGKKLIAEFRGRKA